MKIAISSTGKNIESNVSDVFGRCPYFVIVEIKDKEFEITQIIENKSTSQKTGAGISTGQLIAEKGAEAVITGNVGPRALDVLNQFNIKIYSGSGTIKQAVQEFIKGNLEQTKGSGCEGCRYKE